MSVLSSIFDEGLHRVGHRDCTSFCIKVSLTAVVLVLFVGHNVRYFRCCKYYDFVTGVEETKCNC